MTLPTDPKPIDGELLGNDSALDELERSLHEQLAHLQQQYQRACEPIVLQLVRINDMRPQRYLIPFRDAIAAGVLVGPAKLEPFLPPSVKQP